MTHAFHLYQGRRAHDEAFVVTQGTDLSTPTKHGLYLMRSRLETLWAERFERRGFIQAPCGIVQTPCYFYEPRGMKRWPSYPAGRHYRVDFVLVTGVETHSLEGEQRSRATAWEWISIKPTLDDVDLNHLKDLVAFDSLHQRAFQCIGLPRDERINIVSWNGVSVEVRRA